MAEPRTIDNFDMPAHTRYAQDQQWREDQLFKNVGSVSSQISIDVSLPSFASATDSLLHTEITQTIWANFAPPDRYLEQKGRIFVHIIAPSLGSEEKQESQSQKILTQLQNLQETERPSSEHWQAEITRTQGEKDGKKLVALFNQMAKLDGFSIAINSGRGQYQRG